MESVIPPHDMEENRDMWRSLALRLARHIRNTDNLEVLEWGVKGLDLLGEVRAADPMAYDDAVKDE